MATIKASLSIVLSQQKHNATPASLLNEDKHLDEILSFRENKYINQTNAQFQNISKRNQLVMQHMQDIETSFDKQLNEMYGDMQ